VRLAAPAAAGQQGQRAEDGAVQGDGERAERAAAARLATRARAQVVSAAAVCGR
jgi:hypothetical protein